MKNIIYLSSFLFSEETVKNPNIYPYNVFAQKTEKLLLFDSITFLYGGNASGKSIRAGLCLPALFIYKQNTYCFRTGAAGDDGGGLSHGNFVESAQTFHLRLDL